MPSKDWITDSTHWRGKVLRGPFAHWCDEWDGLPTDMWCPEFESCTCYRGFLFRVCQVIGSWYNYFILDR